MGTQFTDWINSGERVNADDIQSFADGTGGGATPPVEGYGIDVTGYTVAVDPTEIPLSAWANPVAAVALAGNRITGLADPIDPQDAATKNFVEDYVDTYGGTSYFAGDGLSLATDTFSVDSTVARRNATNTFSQPQTIDIASGTPLFLENGQPLAGNVAALGEKWEIFKNTGSVEQGSIRGYVTGGLSATGISIKSEGTLALDATTILLNGSAPIQTGVSNTFTQPQIIDLAASGTPLTLDIHTNGNRYLTLTETGIDRGHLGDSGNNLVLSATASLQLNAASGVFLDGGGTVWMSNNRIAQVAAAASGTDAVSRDFGDGRYAPLTHSHTSRSELPSQIAYEDEANTFTQPLWLKGTTADEQARLHLGYFSDAPTLPAYTFYTDDVGQDRIDLYSWRWSHDFRLRRSSGTGDKTVAYFYGDDGTHALVIRNSGDTADALNLSSAGATFGVALAMGGNQISGLPGSTANGQAVRHEQLATYAPLVSPVFTGDPTGPTPATSDNDTSLATTAFVKNVVGVKTYLPSTIAYEDEANTFTAQQMIDMSSLSAAGVLRISQRSLGGDDWVRFQKAGTTKGYIYNPTGDVVEIGTNAADLKLNSWSALIDVSSKRLANVADATTGTDALNRQSGDARYPMLSASNVFTSVQTIDVGNGTTLILDIGPGMVTPQGFIQMYTDGTLVGQLLQNAGYNGIDLISRNGGLRLSSGLSGDIKLQAADDIDADSNRIKNLAVASAGTDALSRDAGDARYLQSGASNTFTLPQVIDLAASGTPLTLDIHTDGSRYLTLTETGIDRAYIRDTGTNTVFHSNASLQLEGQSGLFLDGGGTIWAGNNRITQVAAATSGTDAVSRDFLRTTAHTFTAAQTIDMASGTGLFLENGHPLAGNVAAIGEKWEIFRNIGSVEQGSIRGYVTGGLSATGISIKSEGTLALDATTILMNGSAPVQTGVSNTFTQPQIIDLAATGNALTLDINTNLDKWIQFTEAGVQRGYLQENNNNIILRGDTGVQISGGSGVTIDGGALVSFAGNRLITVGDATAATDAMNRQSSDARYPQLSLIDGKGDLIVGTADNTMGKLVGVGIPDNYVLTRLDAANLTGLAWQDPGVLVRAKEVFRAYRSGGSYTRSNGEMVVFDAESWDPSGVYNTSDGKFTPTRAGYYKLKAVVSEGGGALSSGMAWQVALYKNGVEVARGTRQISDGSGNVDTAEANEQVYANGSTDYFQVAIYHEKGSAATIWNNSVGTNFSGEFISADYAGSLTTPKFRARRSSNDSARASVASDIPFDTEDYDTNSNFSSTTFTAPVAGKYHFDAQALGAGTYATSTVLQMRLYKNGAAAALGPIIRGTNNASEDTLTISTDLVLAAGDTVSVRVYIGSGNWTTFGDSAAGGYSFFSGHLIRDDAAVPWGGHWGIPSIDGSSLPTYNNWAAAGFGVIAGPTGRGSLALGNNTSTYGIHLTNGAYYDGANWKYGVSGEAISNYYQSNGTHGFRVAAAGTAGNNITWTSPLSITSTDVNLMGRMKMNDSGYIAGSSTHGVRFNNNADTVNLMILSNAGTLTMYQGAIILPAWSGSGYWLRSADEGTGHYLHPFQTYVRNMYVDAFTNYSDERLKQDVKPVRNALDGLKKLVGIEYKNKETKRRTMGVSAQDVQKAFPVLVSNPKHHGKHPMNKMLAVDSLGLLAPVIEAIKELAERVEALESR